MRVVIAGWVVMVSAALLGAGVAQATPPGPPPPCSFTLSPPQVVQGASGPVVTATVSPGACGFPADPRSSVACVRIVGVDSGGQCAQGRGGQPAEVFYAPYRPGATYESSGRGCGAWSGNLPAPDCQILGPIAATL
jgi:hypothetical protein